MGRQLVSGDADPAGGPVKDPGDGAVGEPAAGSTVAVDGAERRAVVEPGGHAHDRAVCLVPAPHCRHRRTAQLATATEARCDQGTCAAGTSRKSLRFQSRVTEEVLRS
jgi:hypothetical protein